MQRYIFFSSTKGIRILFLLLIRSLIIVLNSMHISQLLINWYQDHQRDLPWRQTTDPYKIWLSEIILQQTRVDQGIAYYYQFLKKFPKIEDLAKAEEQTVLRLWQGLGYYSRARNLHKTAQAIVKDYQGAFPVDYDLLIKLKGIGDYTAAAIASHAFGLPYAVVDGNVYRFLARYFLIEEPIDTGKGQKHFKKLANDILDKQNPGLNNQAIMEFGALQCKPKNPNCSICPFVETCQAFAKNKIAVLPVKKGKIKVRNRYFNYFIIQDSSRKIILKQRTEKDVWHNLYDFPMLEKELSETDLISGEFIKSFFNSENVNIQNISPIQIHLLSHQKLYLRFIELNFSPSAKIEKELQAYSREEIENLPLSRPIEQFLNRFLS